MLSSSQPVAPIVYNLVCFIFPSAIAVEGGTMQTLFCYMELVFVILVVLVVNNKVELFKNVFCFSKNGTDDGEMSLSWQPMLGVVKHCKWCWKVKY